MRYLKLITIILWGAKSLPQKKEKGEVYVCAGAYAHPYACTNSHASTMCKLCSADEGKKKKTSHNVTGKALIECVRQARLTRVFHTDGDERLLL